MSVSELLQRDVLVVSQEPKLIEMTNEYRIRDADGADIGSIRQEGQSKVKKALRLFTDVDRFLTHRLGVYDVTGAKVMEMVRPRKFRKSTLQILVANGAERGRIVQQNVVGKKRFALLGPKGDELGSIDAENWRSRDVAIHDASGAEVGRITKQWAAYCGRASHRRPPDVPRHGCTLARPALPDGGSGGRRRHRAEAG